METEVGTGWRRQLCSFGRGYDRTPTTPHEYETYEKIKRSIDKAAMHTVNSKLM
jgi:hypothetical protein